MLDKNPSPIKIEDEDFDFRCFGCAGLVAKKSEFCACGVCPNCCSGDICGTKMDPENPGSYDSDCGRCGTDNGEAF